MRQILLLLFGLFVGHECRAGIALADARGSRRLSEVLNKLKAAYRVDIAYALNLVEGKVVDENMKISYRANLEENLQKVLEPFGLAYKKRHNSYIIIRKEEKKISNAAGLPASGNVHLLNNNRLLAEHIVTGTVRDADTRELLAGVTMRVKGTAQGTITDGEGRYAISVQGDSAVLVFSFMSYASSEALAGTKNSVDIELQTDIKK